MVAIKDLFEDATSSAERAERLEAYKAALSRSASERQARTAAGVDWQPPHADGQGFTAPQVSDTAGALATLTANKALSTELLASLQGELDTLTKDITTSSPVSTGLVPYDLEGPAKFLAPVATPLRNRIPRTKGQGLTRRYKRITGISGSGTGGVANLSPFITDSSTMSSGSLTLRRGPVITYAGDDRTANYKQMGLSDVATWSAQFAGLGFQDISQLSHTALLYGHMLAEERAILAGRGTDAGVYVGALGTPSTANITVSNRAAGTGETGNSANIANLYITISAEGMFGESNRSAEINYTGLSATTGRVVDIVMTGAFVSGATGYKVYAGTATGVANQYFVGRTGCWGGTAGQGTAAFTINFTGGGTGGAPNSGTVHPNSETASSAAAFDGILTTQLDPAQGGIIYSVGGKFSTTNIGVEFQNLFAALYAGVQTTSGYTGTLVNTPGNKARPNVIWMPGQDRKQLSATFLGGGSGNPTFFFNVPANAAEMRMGQVVTGMLNETTGDEVDVIVHPWLAQGTSLVLSETIPTPDSSVPSPFEMVMVQDYIAIDWPKIQFTNDVSTYAFGALVNYAPSFSGAVTNVLLG